VGLPRVVVVVVFESAGCLPFVFIIFLPISCSLVEAQEHIPQDNDNSNPMQIGQRLHQRASAASRFLRMYCSTPIFFCLLLHVLTRCIIIELTPLNPNRSGVEQALRLPTTSINDAPPSRLPCSVAGQNHTHTGRMGIGGIDWGEEVEGLVWLSCWSCWTMAAQRLRLEREERWDKALDIAGVESRWTGGGGVQLKSSWECLERTTSRSYAAHPPIEYATFKTHDRHVPVCSVQRFASSVALRSASTHLRILSLRSIQSNPPSSSTSQPQPASS
jgi:hypothetical protein